MDKLKIQSVVIPTEKIQFEDWMVQLKVSSVWKASSITKRITIDEAIDYKKEYLKNQKQTTEQPSYRISLADALKLFKNKIINNLV
jgi:hypothetical protein